MCNKIITHDKNILKGEQENEYFYYYACNWINWYDYYFNYSDYSEYGKRERIKSVDVAKFDSFAEEMRREIAEIKKDLQTVKEKVEVIDKMMKDI